jgi:hypothetical protein
MVQANEVGHLTAMTSSLWTCGIDTLYPIYLAGLRGQIEMQTRDLDSGLVTSLNLSLLVNLSHSFDDLDFRSLSSST